MTRAMTKGTKRQRAHAKPAVRCAIYTRKSSNEGLEQDFNSLDAQREACEAFILSQKHEGWIARTIRSISYTVTVTEDGFDYGGKAYPSLTKVARVITGAHWSGPRFFGLNGTLARDTPNDPRDD